MLEILVALDEQLFQLLNGQLHCAFLDMVMPYVRNKYFWSPLYLFLLSFLLINYQKKGAWIVLFGILTIVLSDQMSSHLIKPLVGRLRPCQNIDMQVYLRLLVDCGAGKSFVSAHATNHFAIAIFFSGIFQNHFRRAWLVGICWATLVAYGQVYVGVHYPLDVFFGGLLGILIGTFTLFLSRQIVPQQSF